MLQDKIKKTQFTLLTNFWPSIQNSNNCWVCIRKTNALLNLISCQPDIDEIYLYAKDSFEAQYQHFLNKSESIDLRKCIDPKAFTEYSSDMVYCSKL